MREKRVGIRKELAIIAILQKINFTDEHKKLA